MNKSVAGPNCTKAATRVGVILGNARLNTLSKTNAIARVR